MNPTKNLWNSGAWAESRQFLLNKYITSPSTLTWFIKYIYV